MSRTTRWYGSRYLVPTVVGAAAIVLLGSQFSDYGLSDLRLSGADV